MYAPRWAREIAPAGTPTAAGEPVDDVVAATEKAIAASEDFRHTLPPAARLGERRTRSHDKPFEGDNAARYLRERPSLDPVPMPAPPMVESGSAVAVLARVAGAVGLAALAAFFVVGTSPLSFAVKAESEAVTPTLWSRLAGTRKPDVPAPPPARADRLAAAPVIEPPPPLQPRVVATTAVPAEPVPPAPEPARRLERDEILELIRRGEDLVGQGDIAAARLMLTRAAEAGDARAALALGATYDPGVLRRLGVIGVAADAARAREWYERASGSGSGEATRRLEQLAQSAR